MTDQPNLSRVVSERQCQSLLSAAVSNLNLATSHRVIKCLIRANPTALLWLPTADAYDVAYHERNSTIPIYMIVRHPVHCLLMPWIVTHYPWVLDHEYCLEHSPVFELLDMYKDRSNNNCTAATIKQFFEAYPRAFHMEDSHAYRYGYPIHRILAGVGLQECEVDLFKWIAERCPSNLLLETNSDGYTRCILPARCFVNAYPRSFIQERYRLYWIRARFASILLINVLILFVSVLLHQIQIFLIISFYPIVGIK